MSHIVERIREPYYEECRKFIGKVAAAEPAREVAQVLRRSDSLGVVDAGQLTSGGMCSCFCWHT